MSNTLLVKDLLTLYNKTNCNKLNRLFGENIPFQIYSFDEVSSSEYFMHYLRKSTKLKSELLAELLSPKNSIWIDEVKNQGKLYFLVSNSSWKNTEYPILKNSVKLVLIGVKSLPTIEINIM